MGQDFLGVGWACPVTVDSVDGDIALSRYEEAVKQSILIILKTAPGERVMRPDFGCGIHDYVFAPNTTHTAGMVRFHVEEALARFEPRIRNLSVTVDPDRSRPDVLLITISYTIRSTDSRFNLVYPFYLERGDI
ncbi:GPW/gp25 family protein [Desulfatiferula olefinivorans]